MIEKNNDIDVLDYTSNFEIKEFLQEVLIPKAFPNLPANKLNIGFSGVVSEMITNAIEDSYASVSLMINESFITRAILPNSIYSEASLFDLGYTFATPSKCEFALQLWLPDIIKYATRVKNTNIFRYKLDKDTKILMNDYSYKFDYDIIIDYQSIGGNTVFSIYYDIDEVNSISIINNKYIKYQVSSIDWLILFIELQEFERKTDSESITDNLVTVNSDITLNWSHQIAGLDLIYITPQGERLPMKLKTQYTDAEINPFVWYKFFSDQTIKLMFSNNNGYFQPAFNSTIEWTLYTCNGASANFEEYNNKSGVPVQKTGERFSYNASTRMTALCYGPSRGGMDKGDIELLRKDVILAYNTVNVLSNEHDLKLWFDRYGQRYGTKAEFFKRRDDPSGKLFSQFIAITNGSYVYPTNTLTIDIDQDQFDFINQTDEGVDQEFIIKPGHLWEYADEDGEIVRDRVRMVKGINGMSMITDEALPPINTNRPFLFVNPFYIKIFRDPTISANYNYLINHTSWPEDVSIQTNCFYQFQLATFSIERSISKKYNNKYRLEVICVPSVTTDTSVTYINGIGDSFDKANNDLRLLLITRSRMDGETGYIEMDPVELRPGNAILFRTEIAVYDNLRSDMMLEIDLERTNGIHSLITSGSRSGRVFLDSSETSFHFLTLMKDPTTTLTTSVFGNKDYDGYVITNRFANVHRDLTLYKPMSMMHSVITFTGENHNYHIRASLIPFLRYDIPLDEEKMLYFIRAFGDQYKTIEPILSKLDGNLDIKLYNTYGRSNNYYIGPKEGDNVLWNSDILLDNVYVRARFVMSVYDRSLWSQTSESVINEITLFFDEMKNENRSSIHSSDLIHIIIEKHPNVRYIRFLGFNDYDANKSSIFVKYNQVNELNQTELQTHVPEIIRADKYSIEITEEV